MHAPNPLHLHHLPNRNQNIFYILVLIASPLINLFTNSLVYTDFRLSALKGAHAFTAYNWFFGLSSFLFGSVIVLLGINLAQALVLHRHRARGSLLLFGLFSSLYLLINLLTITYGIFAFKVESFFLLFVSICIYLSVNLTFVFWYWYIDYPTQIRHLSQPNTQPEILFPANTQQPSEWLPKFLDYAYFTVLTSNTLGPPENHSPNGRHAKTVVILHSSIMLVLLVVFVSRAINTLA